jgi:rRNA-processing protein FCF1
MERDIFIRELIYPDPQGLIAWTPKGLAQVKDHACVVLDTNALLVPYATGRASLVEIGRTYQSLVSQHRLVVPAQVIREFAGNRVLKLQELHNQLTAKKRVQVSRATYPLLEGSNEYRSMTEIEEQIERLIRSYGEAVNSVLKRVQGWYWDDPVTTLYRDLFAADVVYEPDFKREELQRDLETRIANKIPPGYKDAGKEDGGIGDVLIWHTILDVGKTRKVPLIFVSDDQKADWWHQSDGIPLYPRFELVDEYRRCSGGESFHMMTFSGFLSIAGASETVVAEVERGEQEARAGASARPLAASSVVALSAATDWLRARYGANLTASPSDLFDFELACEENTERGIRLKYLPPDKLRYIDTIIQKSAKRLAAVMHDEQSVRGMILMLVAATPEIANYLVRRRARFERFQGLRIGVGFVNASCNFELVSEDPAD